ncbi:MAG: YHS domain-containing protein [Phycisphaerae bacterium]
MYTAKKNITLILLGCLLLILAIVFTSCKKKEQAPQHHEHEHEAVLTEEASAAAAQIEQKTCPVMPQMKINPDVFTVYQGKKVYFCCPACKPQFEAEPEKYLSNLPQFQK